MAPEPIHKWNHLYCSLEGCGYPITSYPPEGASVTCMACGVEYCLAHVAAPQPPSIKTADATERYSFALDDPSTKMGVSWLENVAAGGMSLCLLVAASRWA